MSQETGAGRSDLRTSQVAGAQHTCYRIDDLVLDVGRARVVRNGRELALGKLSFDLLLALVEAAPNLLLPSGATGPARRRPSPSGSRRRRPQRYQYVPSPSCRSRT